MFSAPPTPHFVYKAKVEAFCKNTPLILIFIWLDHLCKKGGDENKKYQQFYVCFTAFLVLCELPQSGHKFGFSHELRDLAHLTLLDGPIGFNEIGRPTNPTQSL